MERLRQRGSEGCKSNDSCRREREQGSIQLADTSGRRRSPEAGSRDVAVWQHSSATNRRELWYIESLGLSIHEPSRGEGASRDRKSEALGGRRSPPRSALIRNGMRPVRPTIPGATEDKRYEKTASTAHARRETPTVSQAIRRLRRHGTLLSPLPCRHARPEAAPPRPPERRQV